MSDSELNIEYLQLVTTFQAAIFGCIRSIAPGIDIDDVLQETNIELWEKADSFEMGSNFKAFAFRIAHFKTLEALRRQKRGRWLQFDSDLLQLIAAETAGGAEDETAGGAEDSPDLQDALRRCLGTLNDSDRSLVHERYTEVRTVRKIARRHERSEGAMQQVYFRIRNVLRACITRRIVEGGGAA